MAPKWDPTALTTALLGVGGTLFLGTQIGKSHWDDHVEAARTEVLLALTLVVCIAGAIVAWMTVPLVWPSLPEVGEGAGVGAVLSCLAGIVRPSPPKYRRARLERDLGLLREELRRLDRQLPGVPDTRGSRRAAWLRLAMLGLSPLPVAFLVGLVLAAAHRFEQLSDKLIGLPLATELVIGIVYLVVLAALWCLNPPVSSSDLTIPFQRPPQATTRHLGPRLRRRRGVLAPDVTAADAAVATGVAEVGLAASWGEPDPGAGSPEGSGSLLEPVKCGWGPDRGLRCPPLAAAAASDASPDRRAQGTHRAPRWKAATLES